MSSSIHKLRTTILSAFLLTLMVIPGSLLATPTNIPVASSFLDRLFPRRTIDASIMGVNAFVNDSNFGTIGEQFLEVRDTLRLNYVRVLFAWDDNVQPTPNSPIDFSFYDEIARKLPTGVQALVVLTGSPSWMSDSQNWIAGSPRVTFVQNWVRKVAGRYRTNKRIAAFQIWNEPNDPNNSNNAVMEFVDNPSVYVDMLRSARSAIRRKNPKKKVVNAATTAINQSYPTTLNYNRAMLEAGALSYVDAWAVHYYGKQYENVLRPNGVEDVLDDVSRPIWITESGAKGVNSQREYVERTWPFLRDRIPGIKRFYLYQFTEATDAEVTYGLKNLTAGFSISDLYIYLRDRATS